MKSARNHTEIGKLLKYHRQLQALSQKELATKTGLSQPAVSNIEHGIGGNLRAVESIMQALNLELYFKPVRAIDTSDMSSQID